MPFSILENWDLTFKRTSKGVHRQPDGFWFKEVILMEINGFNLPDELYYEENHFWLRPEKDIFIMGMDDFGQQLAGDIVYVQLPEDGKLLKAGKKFAKIEWVG